MPDRSLREELTLDLGEVDALADALGEGLADGVWDHWDDDARGRLERLASRSRQHWNDSPRAAREEFM